MSDSEPHAKGCMKPPEATRFRKGSSGNPNGRPKKIDDPYEALQKVLARRVQVAGEDRRITIREALIRRLRDLALAGDRRAMELQRKILVAAGALRSSDEAPVDLEAEKRRLLQLINRNAAAAAQGGDGGDGGDAS